MGKNWKDAKEEIDRETQRVMFTPPEEVLKIFKYGIVESDAGSYGQYFTALVFIEGDCRALAYYNANNLICVADNEGFDLEQLKFMTRLYLPVSAEFLGYCGLKNIWKFTQGILDALDTLNSKEEFKELVNSFNLYIACVHTWIHHFFPWNVGGLFPKRKPEEIREMMRLIENSA